VTIMAARRIGTASASTKSVTAHRHVATILIIAVLGSMLAGCADESPTCLGTLCYSDAPAPSSLPSGTRTLLTSSGPISGLFQLAVSDERMMLALTHGHGQLDGAMVEVDLGRHQITPIYSEPETIAMFPAYLFNGQPVFQVADGTLQDHGLWSIWSAGGRLFPFVDENHWLVDWGEKLVWARESRPQALYMYDSAAGSSHEIRVPPHVGWEPAQGSTVSRFSKLVGDELWVVVETPGNPQPHSIVAFDPDTQTNRTVYESSEPFVDFLMGEGEVLLTTDAEPRIVDLETGQVRMFVDTPAYVEGVTCEHGLQYCVFSEIGDEGRRLAWQTPAGYGYVSTREDYRMYALHGTTLYFGDATNGWHLYALDLGLYPGT
jgi:hypothetical protein